MSTRSCACWMPCRPMSSAPATGSRARPPWRADMETLDNLRERLPEAAKDIKLNVQAVLSGGALTPAQRWGVAVASALTARHPDVSRAVIAEARQHAGDAVVEDAVAAAALMSMNNVFYRFRHRIGKAEYGDKPARLRM